MNTTELCFLSAVELGRLIGTKKVSPVEVVQAHLERIEATEPTLNSFITRPGEEVLEAARQAESEIVAGGYRGVLHGVPVGLKDLYHVAGMPNTSGSRIFEDFVPDHDGASAASLKEAGAILMGKLNLHQFAFGPTGLNADYGHMHNPWDTDRMAGGSSGGSGSAAAAGQCAITLGTDTGGSIRIPSALCGLAGLKPTYGRVSRYGLTSLSWSLDHPGPMARTVEDCAAALQVLAGYDPRDPASAQEPVPNYMDSLSEDLTGLKVGVPREYFEVPLDAEVAKLVRTALKTLEDLGAEGRGSGLAHVSPVRRHFQDYSLRRSGGVSSGSCYCDGGRNTTLRCGGGSSRVCSSVGRTICGRCGTGGSIPRRRGSCSSRWTCWRARWSRWLRRPLRRSLFQVNGESVGVIPALTQYTRPFNLDRLSGADCSLWLLRRLAGGLAVGGAPLRGGHGVAGGICLPTSDGVAQAQAAHLGTG